MATARYINIDTGDDTTGTGTSGNPWKTISKAHASSLTEDVIYCAGNAQDTSLDISVASFIWNKGLTVVRDPASSGKYRIRLNPGTSVLEVEFTNSGNNFQGIQFDLEQTGSFNVAQFMEMDTDNLTFVDCDFIVTPFAAANESKIVGSTSVSGDHSIRFFSCDIDLGNSATIPFSSGTGVVMQDCDIHGHVNAGTGSADSLFTVASPITSVTLIGNRFYDNNHSYFLYQTEEIASANFAIMNNTFFYSSTDTNLLGIVRNSSLANDQTWANMVFNSNLLENETGTSRELFEYDVNTIKNTGALAGSNVYKGFTAGGYVANSAYTDTISTTSNFKNTTVGHADFLRLTSTADAIDHSIYENLDAGAYEAAGGGGAGETDVNKVLSTSILVSGTINPNTVLDTNVNGTLDSANVLVASGGTLVPDYADPANLAANDTSNGVTGLIALSDIRETAGPGTLPNDAITQAQGGNFHDPENGEVASGAPVGVSPRVGTRIDAVASNVLVANGNFGDPLLPIIPTLVPDYADAANLTANDTTNGITGLIPLSAVKVGEGAGTLPLNKIAPSQGGSYLGDESNDLLLAAELESGVSKNNLGVIVNGTNKGENFNDVLLASQIAVGQSINNLGITVLGTYDANERYSDLATGLVVLGTNWRYNSLINNRSGIRIDADAAFVKFGSGNYGDPGSPTVPAYVPDFSDPANTLENDTTDGVTGLVPLNKLAPSQGGSYLGDESNDLLEAEVLKNGETRQNLGVPVVGNFTGSVLPPIPNNKVEDLYEYEDSLGSQVGSLGRVNTADADIAKQLRTNAEGLFTTYLPNYTKLDYMDDVRKNDYYGNTLRYGILTGQLEKTFFLLNKETVDVEFTVRLVNDFDNDGDDQAARDAADVLIADMELLRRRVTATRAGNSPQNVRRPNNWDQDAPEYDEDHNIVILEATFTLNFKISI